MTLPSSVTETPETDSDRVSEERLREMVGMNVPCVPATPGEVAALVQAEIARRAALRSRPTETDKAVPAPATGGEVEGLIDRLLTFRLTGPLSLGIAIDEAVAALRRDEGKGVREAALEEAAKVADMFAADHAKSADQFGIDRNRELHNAAKGAAQGVAFAIRALSASPAPEEQVTDVEADRRERASKVKPDKYGHRTRFSDSSYFDEVCIMCGATDGFGDKRLDQPCPKPLPRFTTGGAK